MDDVGLMRIKAYSDAYEAWNARNELSYAAKVAEDNRMQDLMYRQAWWAANLDSARLYMYGYYICDLDKEVLDG